MKKNITFGFILVLLVAFGVFFYSANNKKNISPVLGDSENSLNSQNSLVLIDNYEVLWYKVQNIDRLILKSNLDNKDTATTLFSANNCEFLINGGFYSPEFKHLGLLVSDGMTVSEKQNNSLLNGFISVNSMATPKIGVLADEEIRLALQTGPLLMENGQLKTLNIKNDKYARRSIAMVTGANELVFAIIYSGDARFSGPLLSETPGLIEIFSQKTTLHIADAINLDGGKASAFITSEIAVTELSPVGSLFCVVK